MIETLTTSCKLYRVHQHRQYYQDKLDKRKAFLLTCLIVLCVGISTLIWIVYA